MEWNEYPKHKPTKVGRYFVRCKHKHGKVSVFSEWKHLKLGNEIDEYGWVLPMHFVEVTHWIPEPDPPIGESDE